MATPYKTFSIDGQSLPLPRVHIPTWFKIETPSEHSDATLDFNFLLDENSNLIYKDNDISDSSEYNGTKLLNLGGVDENIDNAYKGVISIGNVPPREGSIIAYSNDADTWLEGTNSAHILYFKNAVLRSFNFAVPHNHVIQRIGKLYRAAEFANSSNILTNIVNSSVSEDALDKKMVINSTNESDAKVESNTTILVLVEKGF